MRIKSLIILFYVLFWVCVMQARAQDGKDFFITSNPGQLDILNRYQQRISNVGLSALAPFTPLIILEKETTLSDQFTKAMRVQWGRNDYFVLLDEENQPISGDTDTYYEIFENCRLLSDTVEVALKRGVLFSNVPIGSKNINYKQRYLSPETKMLRIFEKNRQYFVHLQGPDTEYGWIRLTSSKSLKKIKTLQTENPNDELTRLMLDQVQKRVDAMNKNYVRFFNYFNSTFHLSKPTPQWQMSVEDQKILLQLQPAKYAADLRKSTQYFIGDLEGIFIGSTFTVFPFESNIEIRGDKP